ncbi:olfactory receptor 2G3-like [Alligator mississippiensis]|uniref:Olfactory receptor 2G3-like n=1 Tax=Alligator mississippiensis TaxID=8496 RepID=A0A151M5T1_ALLMI|nr:olfactory receptor 2G3-like [Alligator mississippiensis]
MPALLLLACVDTSFNEAELFSVSVFALVVPVSIILVSYGYIGAAVLKIRSAEARRKAFSTCTSHLAVVSLFYGLAIYMFLQPPSKGQGKIVSLFYTMVTPMLNPLIYTLRNKEVMHSKTAWENQPDENQSTVEGFFLVGVSDQPQLELLFYVFVLICYIMTLFGNVTIIVISQLDPRLHTPMYFFLSNLSFLDICYTSSVGPQMLVNFHSTRKFISWGRCVAQLYIAFGLGSTECLLLAVMAFDRYAAVCRPLHYTTIMSHRLCLLMAAGSWLSGLVVSLANTLPTMQVPRCGRNHIDNIFCEMPALLKLACVDTSFNEAVLLSVSVLILVVPVSLILVSYGYIGAAVVPRCGQNHIDHIFCEVPTLLKLSRVDTSINEAALLSVSVMFLVVPVNLILVSYGYIGAAVMRIHLAEARHKAFSTCTSHLAVVSIFFGPGIYAYLQPPSKGQDRIASLFYTMVTPMLNPLIYTLRNKEAHEETASEKARLIGLTGWG